MIYFDSAATTLQKPPEVFEAVYRAMQSCASPGRGDYPGSQKAEQIIYRCREEICHLFDFDNPSGVIFTMNATHSLNLAIRSLVFPDSTVLISSWEHNAVTRTLASIPNVNVQVAKAPLFCDQETISAFRHGLSKHPSAVVCTCVSNVFGYILPVREIAQLCEQAEVPLILDASQAAGSVSFSAKDLPAQFIAFPGHKGLYGPQGTGVLLCRETAPLRPLLTGGTGSESIRQAMPDFLPDLGEAGTHNVPGIAGLLAGIRFLRRRGVSAIAAKEHLILNRILTRLPKGLPLTPVASSAGNQSGVLSFRCDGIDCQRLASYLGKMGICTRAGIHCAPLAHESAGTLGSGTLRISFSAFNEIWEADRFINEISQLVYNNFI